MFIFRKKFVRERERGWFGSGCGTRRRMRLRVRRRLGGMERTRRSSGGPRWRGCLPTLEYGEGSSRTWLEITWRLRSLSSKLRSRSSCLIDSLPPSMTTPSDSSVAWEADLKRNFFFCFCSLYLLRNFV